MTDQIATIRADLAAWSERQPKAVQNAVANLDGWLEIAGQQFAGSALGGPRSPPVVAPGTWQAVEAARDSVDILGCTARAVETLRRAQHEFAKI